MIPFLNFSFCLAVASLTYQAHAFESHESTVIRNQARSLVQHHCNQCHTSGSATSLPKALKVFNLAEVDWAEHMNVRQLDRALWMMRERRDMTVRELGYLLPTGSKVPKPPTRNEVDAFEAFIHSEIDQRQRVPSELSEPTVDVANDTVKFRGH